MKKGSILIYAGLLLIAAAICLTCFNLITALHAGEASDEILSGLLPQIRVDPAPVGGRPVNVIPAQGNVASDDAQEAVFSEIEYPDYVLNPEMEMPVQTVQGYDCIGVLRIPALDRELPIFSDWDYRRLKVAPCRYTGSAYLDNMTICAHNYNRHFGLLRNLSLGDLVTFTDMDGNEFRYRVGEVEILQPTAISEMTDSDWDLSLFTCTVGGRTRVTVRCSRETDTGMNP